MRTVFHTGANRLRNTRIRHSPSARQDDPDPLSRAPVRQPGPAHKLYTLVLGKNDLHSGRTTVRHEKKAATNPQNFWRITPAG
ncbi:hypothetical protein [Streptomyces sp. NPDC002491]